MPGVEGGIKPCFMDEITFEICKYELFHFYLYIPRQDLYFIRAGSQKHFLRLYIRYSVLESIIEHQSYQTKLECSPCSSECMRQLRQRILGRGWFYVDTKTSPDDISSHLLYGEDRHDLVLAYNCFHDVLDKQQWKRPRMKPYTIYFIYPHLSITRYVALECHDCIKKYIKHVQSTCKICSTRRTGLYDKTLFQCHHQQKSFYQRVKRMQHVMLTSPGCQCQSRSLDFVTVM